MENNSECSTQHRANYQVVRFSLATASLAFAAFIPESRPTSTQDQQMQVIELKAKKYEFVPSPIHVRNATKVLLKITAVDHDHGLQNPNGS